MGQAEQNPSMAIISEVEEESSSRPSMLPFRATFDSSDPLGFLQKVFDFLGEQSDYLKKPSAEEEIAAVVRAAKEKLNKAEKESVEKKPADPVEEKPTMAASSSKPKENKEAGPIGKYQIFFLLKKRSFHIGVFIGLDHMILERSFSV